MTEHLGTRSTTKRERIFPISEGCMTSPYERLTVAEVCAELRIARSTFYEWRAKGRAPRCIKLPNGDLRIRRSELERWLEAHEDVA
jgi:excisionase family DNA binding protein